MQSAYTPAPEGLRPRQENPPSQSSSNYRQSQGYITLSPGRRNKDRSRVDRNVERFEIEHEKSVSEQLGQFPLTDSLHKQNENGDNLPIRTQQFFKKIPKFSLQEVTIRQAFAEGNGDSISNRKKKLSVTKLFSNIDLSNRSQEGGSVNPAYKLRDFDVEK